jgi:lipopolysaccharide export system permease protein
MYSDSEMVALAACGYGPGQLLRTALLAALPVAALTALLALFVGPRTADLADEVLIEARGRALVSAIVPGRFSQVGDGAVYHVSEVETARSTTSARSTTRAACAASSPGCSDPMARS